MSERSIRRRGLARYLLFQIPGWLVVGFVAWHARSWFGIGDGMALAVCLGWLLKDAVLYPFVRRAYEPHPAPEPSAALIGQRGVVTSRLASDQADGWVRVGSELWRAECATREPPLEPGSRVRVRAVRGFTLVVEPDAEPH